METEIRFSLLTEKHVETEELSPLVLAYLGDAVYELMVRTLLVNEGLAHVAELHRKAVELVRAGTQAQLLHEVKDWLTQEELRVMKRGRNAKSGHTPKNADVVDYRHSTGFESLIGYWYLKGEEKRMQDFFSKLVMFYLNGREE